MNQQELKHILSSKFDFEKWKDLLGTMFLKIDYLTKPIQIEAALVKSGGQVGVIRLDDGRSLGLFKFEVADNIKIARNRKGLRDIAIKYVDQDITHGALVFYYSEDQADYRLTFVSKQTSLNEDGEFVTKATAPKRYTFLLGENEPCTTAANRLLELINKKKSGSVYLADVTEAFSVERLNKDFFKGYKDQYGKFLKYLGEQSKANRDYVKKLLGRLVFLQFLQKKGWMGVPVNNTNWEGGDKNYLNNLIENYKGNNRLLSDVLEVLFFNTLNEKRDNDLADKILGENIKIPYLNGGLFDKDSLDKLDIDFPYDYFKELMEFFAMYNFTIDENDPDDAEVGVDPEMLGHIFENLLEDNKDKGAFYTPKEIVQYMSQESIAQYLKTHTEKTLHTAIEGLIKERKVDEALQNKASASKVYDLLRDVKVCDPAIGSGAFPMGVLNVLYHSRLVLYGFTKSKESFSPAAVKREIIQNNIYGVDIEQGAIDIARLRFWLALVVDELKPEPLPNLDYKIMQGNSLLESFEGLDMSRIAGRTVGRPSNSPQLIIGLDSDLNRKNLQKLMRQYFSTDDHTAKAELRQTINNEVKSLIRNSLGGTNDSLNHLEQLDCSANSDFFLWHTWFKDVFNNGGFDVVIGNPPYIRPHHLDEETKQQLWRYYPTYEKKADIYVCFLERAIKLTKTKGVVTFIVSDGWLRLDSFEKLRLYLLKETDVNQIVDFTKDVFDSATVKTCILSLTKGLTPNHQLNSAIIDDKVDLDNIEFNRIPQSVFDTTYKHVFDLSIESTSMLLKEHIKNKTIPLGKKFSLSFGLKTGDDEKYLTFDPMVSPHCKKLLRGANVNRWIIDFKGEYVIYLPEEMRKNKSTARPGNKKRFEQPKVLVRDTGGGLMATYDNDNYYVKDVIIIEDEHCNESILKVLSALLNSKTLRWYYETSFPTLHVQRDELAALPIPKSVFETELRPIINFVDQILSAKKENPQADTREMEQEIDFLVYKLYGLSYDEILIVDPRTPITIEEYETMIK